MRDHRDLAMESGERVFLSLGSNQGDRVSNIFVAIERLGLLRDTVVVAKSSIVETEPWGEVPQPKFLNAVVEIRTSLSPHALLTALKKIETELGRIPTYRWGPRIIDIDIIAFGRRKIRDPDLVIPHCRASEREFVMGPLREIASIVADDLASGTLCEEGPAGMAVSVDAQLSLMKEALKAAERALTKGEIPIGAAIGRLNADKVDILASSYNCNIQLRRRIAHAEMRALNAASDELVRREDQPGPGDLSAVLDTGITFMASTVEPCIMCFSAAILSGIDHVLFGLRSPRDSGPNRIQMVSSPSARYPTIVGGLCCQEVRALFSTWLSRHAPGDRHWKFVEQLLEEKK